MLIENQKNWDRWVPLGLLAYKSSKHEVTGFTPAELNLDRELRLPIDLLRGCPPETGNVFQEGGYSFRLRERMNHIHNVANQREFKVAKDKNELRSKE
ncbi:hypothetical protein P5V15_010192 [Pogonomyrmex californicus]